MPLFPRTAAAAWRVFFFRLFLGFGLPGISLVRSRCLLVCGGVVSFNSFLSSVCHIACGEKRHSFFFFLYFFPCPFIFLFFLSFAFSRSQKNAYRACRIQYGQQGKFRRTSTEVIVTSTIVVEESSSVQVKVPSMNAFHWPILCLAENSTVFCRYIICRIRPLHHGECFIRHCRWVKPRNRIFIPGTRTYYGA